MGSLSISKTKNKGGRPRVDATPVMVRLLPTQRSAVDAWIASQPDPKPTRPEAIRRLIDLSIPRDSK